MAKPEVKSLLSTTNDLGFTFTVCEPTVLWILIYQFKPVTIRRTSEHDPIRKYERVAFAQKGSAINLAKKMNKMFNSVDFDIRQV